MPLQPKLLNFENTQFLAIGEGVGEIGKATEQQGNDEKQDKDTPLEEMEKLEHEDEIRVQHLKGKQKSSNTTCDRYADLGPPRRRLCF